jgi:hypothetical protein
MSASDKDARADPGAAAGKVIGDESILVRGSTSNVPFESWREAREL